MTNGLTDLYEFRYVVDGAPKAPVAERSRAVYFAKEAFKRGHTSTIERRVNGGWVPDEQGNKSLQDQCAKLGPEDMIQPKARTTDTAPANTLSKALSELARTASFLAKMGELNEDAVLVLGKS